MLYEDNVKITFRLKNIYFLVYGKTLNHRDYEKGVYVYKPIMHTSTNTANLINHLFHISYNIQLWFVSQL